MSTSRSLSTPQIARQMTRRYLMTVSVIFVTLLSSTMMTDGMIHSWAANTGVIDVSERQRLLSQRTLVLAEQLVSVPDHEQQARLREELREATDLLRSSHNLLTGVEHRPQLSVPITSDTQSLYYDEATRLDAHVHAHLDYLDRLVAMPPQELRDEDPALHAAADLAGEELLVLLDSAVALYVRHARERVEWLAKAHHAIILVTLLALVLEVLFVFRPTLARMTSDMRQLLRLERRLDQLAHQDSLTGLANRRLLLDRLAAALAPVPSQQKPGAMLLLDLDGFKAVNDRCGHDAGDALLREVARRLSDAFPEPATVARLGGDEFVILLTDLAGDDAAPAAVARVQALLAEPVRFGDDRLKAAASIGITIFRKDGDRPATLLKNADVALYRAKKSGPGRHAFFENPAMV